MYNPLGSSDWMFRWTKHYPVYRKSLQINREFTTSVITKRRAELLTAASDTDKPEKGRLSLLDILLRSDLTGRQFTNQEVYSQVNNFMFAVKTSTWLLQQAVSQNTLSIIIYFRAMTLPLVLSPSYFIPVPNILPYSNEYTRKLSLKYHKEWRLTSNASTILSTSSSWSKNHYACFLRYHIIPARSIKNLTSTVFLCWKAPALLSVYTWCITILTIFHNQSYFCPKGLSSLNHVIRSRTFHSVPEVVIALVSQPSMLPHGDCVKFVLIILCRTKICSQRVENCGCEGFAWM